MASKKATAPGGTPEAFMKDMEKVLKKHGVKASVTMKADSDCPDGFSLQLVTRTLPNGDVTTELECVKD
jgi:hypothetical protein